jgi:hypothetical protein
MVIFIVCACFVLFFLSSFSYLECLSRVTCLRSTRYLAKEGEGEALFDVIAWRKVCPHFLHFIMSCNKIAALGCKFRVE